MGNVPQGIAVRNQDGADDFSLGQFNTDSQILTINSYDRTSQSLSASNFTVNLQNFANKFNYVKLLDIRLLNSWYNIMSDNNTLSWTSNSQATTSTLTAGQYTATTLATEIQTQMNADKDAGDTNTYTVSYSTTTKKFTISGDTTTFGLNFATSTALAYILGYAETNLSGSQSYIAGNCADLQRVKLVNIETNLPTKNHVCSSDGSVQKYIASLPCNFNSGQYIDYNRDDVNFVQLSGNMPIYLSIQLRDHHGNIIDTNGVDTQFVFQFV